MQHVKTTISLYEFEEGRVVWETFGGFMNQADERIKGCRLPRDRRLEL
jgi:hypothetical protein